MPLYWSKTQKWQTGPKPKLNRGPTASNPRKHSSSLAASDWSISNSRLFPQIENEGERRNERARETALNIDGALRFRSIRQPSSHNYTSARSRMIHHADTHNYISQALGPKNIYKVQDERTAGTGRPIFLWAFMYKLNSAVCKFEWRHVCVILSFVTASVWLCGYGSIEHVLKCGLLLL